MPYPNQYQSGGFGGNSFANAANPSPAAYPMGNMTAASRVQPSGGSNQALFSRMASAGIPMTGTGASGQTGLPSWMNQGLANRSDPNYAQWSRGLSGSGLDARGGMVGGGGNNSSLNVNAGSKSVNPFGMGAPDLSLADPNILRQLDISNLIYSPSAGGYLFSGRNYSGMGNNWGGDNNANQRAANFYSYIGSLPTANRGSPALSQLTGGNLGHGPSYNNVLSNFFNTASPYVQDFAKRAGFGPTYRGPYGY